MTAPDTIMVFAAGLGTRMHPLTANRPKPLIHVCGKPLIDHALDLVRPLGLKTVVNLHYHADQLCDHLSGSGVQLSDETDLLRDTGGGLKHAADLLGHDPVYTLNTDAVWKGKNPLAELAEAWDPDRMDAALLLIRPENAWGHKGKGDFLIDGDSRLTRGPGPIYAGAQIIKTDRIFRRTDLSFSLNEIWDEMLADGRLFGVLSESLWCDVGQPDSIALAETMMEGANVSAE